jgi:hypothetical protein
MNAFLNEEFRQAVRDRLHYPFPGKIYESDVEWNNVIHLLDTHPGNKDLKSNVEKLNFNLLGLEGRGSAPGVSRTIVADLRFAFPQNKVTSQFFGGLTKLSRSFEIHKDKMDVLYYQAIGKVEFSIWDSEVDAPNIERKVAKNRYRKTMEPGEMCWIPRGTYHRIIPLESRVALSFGVEEEPDPSTYA